MHADWSTSAFRNGLRKGGGLGGCIALSQKLKAQFATVEDRLLSGLLTLACFLLLSQPMVWISSPHHGRRDEVGLQLLSPASPASPTSVPCPGRPTRLKSLLPGEGLKSSVHQLIISWALSLYLPPQ